MKNRAGWLRASPGCIRGSTNRLRPSSSVTCLAALVSFVGWMHPARAQENELGQARVHLRRAAAASDLGNYKEAAKEYEAAYIETSDTSLLVTVGETWLLAGEQQKALTAFRSCARLTSDAALRATCTAKSSELEQRPDRQPASATSVGAVPPPWLMAPPPAPAPYAAAPPVPPVCGSRGPCPPPSTWPLWVAVGAVVVAGVVVGVVYARQSNDLAMPITTFGTKQF
jgi:hypothetical protein